MSGLFAGIDIGGTFTDVVIVDPREGRRFAAKALTTHAEPAEGALTALREALDRASAEPGDVERAVHATTLATNVILERKGASVAYVTTEGFGDLLVMGADRRGETDKYDLFYEKEPPPVPRSRTLEIRERLDPQGSVVTPLDPAQAERELEPLLKRDDVEAVAICFLHSYANPDHERRVAELVRSLAPGLYVAESARIWPEYREFDRASTTVMAAYVGPVVSRYLAGLQDELDRLGVPGSFQVMRSDGGLMSAETARDRPIDLLESGPAAGVIAAAEFGRAAGRADVISFDMGGTTAKAGLVRGGRPSVTHDFHVGGLASSGARAIRTGFPVKIPVIDLAEVGAGGGSLARVDAAGALHVGPESAGSEPGPACYARGGTRPTVTDANLVLGYLNPDYFLGGSMRIDAEAGRRAVAEHVAGPLGMQTAEAAAGIHEIANASMAAAIRIVTVERGVDPRDFALLAFGGAGPAHAVRVAEEYDIPEVIVPPDPGVSSALGLLVSETASEFGRTRILDQDAADPARIEAIYAELELQGRRTLAAEGVAEERIEIERRADLRFRYQSHALSVGLPAGRLRAEDLERAAVDFRGAYERTYGVRQEDPVQFVGYRVRAVGRGPRFRLAPLRAAPSRPSPAPVEGSRPVYFRECGGFTDTAVHRRERLFPGQVVAGPAIVEEPASSTVVPPDYAAEVDAYACLVIRKA